jgi:tetratricopeptide (TPR) repeat protein
MNKKALVVSLVAIAISFIGGFLLANALNRNELESLRAENTRLKNSPTKPIENDSELTLSDAEVRQKIAVADQNPSDLKFQKSLGTALYRYAAMKQDANLLKEVSRLLHRAQEKSPTDYDLLITLGNLYFDIGYFQKDSESFARAREFYQNALAQKPSDADTRTDYALTFFLQNPPDYDQAAAELKRSLEDNPKHEKTLQFLTQTLVRQGKTQEAETYLAKLKEINPKTPTLSEIQAQTAESESKK